jgi:hypothetical protein
MHGVNMKQHYVDCVHARYMCGMRGLCACVVWCVVGGVGGGMCVVVCVVMCVVCGVCGWCRLEGKYYYFTISVIIIYLLSLSHNILLKCINNKVKRRRNEDYGVANKCDTILFFC